MARRITATVFDPRTEERRLIDSHLARHIYTDLADYWQLEDKAVKSTARDPAAPEQTTVSNRAKQGSNTTWRWF